MEDHIFCDGIGRIAVIGGVVRLDLFTFSPTETDASGNARPVLSHRIVMGTDGFLRSSEKIVEAVQLIGRARPAQPQAAQSPGAPQPPPRAQAPQPAPQAQPQWPPQAAQPAPQAQPLRATKPPPAPRAPEPPPPARPPFP